MREAKRWGREQQGSEGASVFRNSEAFSRKALESMERGPQGNIVLFPSTPDDHLPGLVTILPDL